MIKGNQKIKNKAAKLYNLIRKVLMKVNEINAGIGLFKDEIGKLYLKIINRLFDELGFIIGFFDEEYDDDNIFFIVEQDILFPEDEDTEFSIFLYRKLFSKLLSKHHEFEPTPLTNALENYFLDKIISMENSFNKTFYRSEIKRIPEIVKSEYSYFLDNLNEVFQFNFVLFFDEYGSLLNELTSDQLFVDSIFDKIPSLYFIEPSSIFDKEKIPYVQNRSDLKTKFITSKAWSSLIEDIYNYINNYGYGEISRYYYFEWDNKVKKLKGYKIHKNILIKDIVGYEEQIKELVFNTKSFIKELPANNVLIYGYRGCGKTSTIFALLNEFKEKSLRLVKITKEDMDDLPLIVDLLSKRKEKFIISPDDLSYEENDPEYKRHKVIIDAMLDRCPKNVIIYATSNTQDLVKFNKRFTTDDIKIDNRNKEEKKLEFLDKQLYDERRALTDRFGLTLLFGKPDKEIYSEMLFLHAKQAGVDISNNKTKESLLKEYESWTLTHGTPCGRSAYNFIGYLTAKQKMKNKKLSE